MKWFFRIAVLMIVLIAAGVFYVANINNYQLTGEIKVAGLDKDVVVRRDKMGMPYIEASSYRDLIFAQGYVAAQDRLFQMHLTRLYAEGRLTELAGEEAKASDIKMRTLGFARNARIHAQLLNQENIDFLQAFADGVNAFIDKGEDIPVEFKLAGLQPEKWTIENSISLIYLMGWGASANIQSELLSLNLLQKVGVERFVSLYPMSTNPDSPSPTFDSLILPVITELSQINFSQQTAALFTFSEQTALQWGSNSWAVAGHRSKSGAATLASDPHLDSRMLPGVMHPQGLFLNDEITAVGVTIPGIPGLLIGRTAHITNGITNAYLDVQDLYIEKVDPSNPNNYLEGEKSIPFEKIEEVLKLKNKEGGFTEEKLVLKKTKRGVVISDIYPDLNAKQVISLRYAPFENMGDKLGIDFLLKGKSVADAALHLQELTTTSHNIVVADAKGDIGMFLVGRVPIRKVGTGRLPQLVKDSTDNWLGWIPFQEMPHQKSGPKGWVGTANHNSVPADYPHYISNHFSPNYRYSTLKVLLNSKRFFSVDDHWQYQRDDFNALALKFTPEFIKALSADKETAALAEELGKWNYRQDISSPGAAIFQQVYRRFVKLTFEDELGEDFSEEFLDTWYYWQERFEQMVLHAETSVWWDNVKTPQVKESRDDLIRLAGRETINDLSKRFGKNMKQWQWGKMHTIQYTNPIRREGFGAEFLGTGKIPMGGSGETLYRSLYEFSKPDEIAFSACMRMVSDMGDKDKVIAVVNGGLSARSFHPFRKNQLDAFHSGEQLFWWLNKDKVKENTEYELVLKPNSK